jgi:hypothetical protein
MSKTPPDRENAIAKALMATLISPNECDSNWEAANAVDGLFAVARAIWGLAAAVKAGREPNEAGNPEPETR